jgi:hypothetical protein
MHRKFEQVEGKSFRKILGLVNPWIQKYEKRMERQTKLEEDVLFGSATDVKAQLEGKETQFEKLTRHAKEARN